MMIKWDLFQRMQGWFNIHKLNQGDIPNKIKAKIIPFQHMKNKYLTKFNSCLWYKRSLQSRYKGIIPQQNKYHDKPSANILLNCKKLKAFLLRSNTRQKYLLSSLLFNIVSVVLVRIIKQAKENKNIQIWKEESKLRHYWKL